MPSGLKYVRIGNLTNKAKRHDFLYKICYINLNKNEKPIISYDAGEILFPMKLKNCIYHFKADITNMKNLAKIGRRPQKLILNTEA